MGKKRTVKKKDGSRVIIRDGRIIGHVPGDATVPGLITIPYVPTQKDTPAPVDYMGMLHTVRSYASIPDIEVREEPSTGVTVIYAVMQNEKEGEKGEEVGWLQLNPANSDGKRTIRNIEVLEEYRRRGIATQLWEKAVALGWNPQHDERRTAAGDAWATSVGSEKPENIVAQWHDYEYQDMRTTNLTSETLSFGKFSETLFEGAQLNELHIQQSSFINANMRQVAFSNSTAKNCDFTKTDLTQVVGDDSCFTSSTLVQTKFVRAKLRNVQLRNVTAERVDFTEADLTNGTFTNTSVVGANFKNASLQNTRWEQVDVTGVNFMGADLTGAVMDNIKYDDSTVWPSGFRPPVSS